jgi:hypothetical protein
MALGDGVVLSGRGLADNGPPVLGIGLPVLGNGLTRSSSRKDLRRLSLFLSDPSEPLAIIEFIALPYQSSDIVRSSWRQQK